jgi:predicted esterase
MSDNSRKLQWINWKLALFLLVGVAVLLGIQYITYERPPLPEAINAFENNDILIINNKPWLTFSPTDFNSKTGFIFYPGGRIDPQGYASLMRTIANEGYFVVVPIMPLNMAVFNSNIADKIIATYPDVNRWVIGGHSVGGTMAAQYTNTHGELIDGLVIWASYPADSTDLSDFDLPVVSIYGSLDPRVNQSSVVERQHLLPEDTIYFRIEGGDHHQFGSYEIDPKDNHATISRESQHEQILQSTLSLLETASETE